ncbi:hypothetical protein PBAL39_16024 [Pedobacter sp. BAL39]|uniref:hypothetical protein n=1 Tax=Pedobacter sp. BAL39 TaxID=391596 RepID=UPI00015592AD|nr:hypothetical protein [Pedobacter sp. BAL39]EDM37948.1 hypothetical protein PBAL39_16024 [Pedobacter sp. BAL39]
MKLNPFLVIKLVLAIFIMAGLGLTVFLVMQDVKIVGAYLVSGLFILVPGMILYGLTFGFRNSEKTTRKQAEKQESVTFDPKGISYELPLFDTTLYIDWTNIEAVLYTNYQSDDNAEIIFHLIQPPRQTMAENPWFLNRIFPLRFSYRKEITIADDCKNFGQIPAMLEKYLVHVEPIDLTEDYKRGTLLSSKTAIKNDRIRTEQHWQPNHNYEREKVIYDKYGRTFQQIKQKGNV